MRLSFSRRCKFGKAKVAELDVTPSVIEDVGWLEILQVQVIALGVHSKDQEMCSSCFASLQTETGVLHTLWMMPCACM